MKRLIVASTSVLLAFFAVAPAVQAREITTTPFDLVSLARNGYLSDQGVPSFAQLGVAHQRGRLSAEDLVQAAIDDNRLSPEAINDRGYVSAVNSFLRGLTDSINN